VLLKHLKGVGRKAKQLHVPEEDRVQLVAWSRSPKTPQRLGQQSRILLAAAEGKAATVIADELHVSIQMVKRWRLRYEKEGLTALTKPRPRGKPIPPLAAEKRQAIIYATLHEKPAGATHWSTRTMAKKMGVSATIVGRIWRANGLKPHLSRTFKLSRDKHFAEKVQDVVGLYMNPPENALVLSVDEKSQIQALDRTQPGLPLKKGRCGTMTHDYKRHGTTTLFAALDVSHGTVIAANHKRHRHQEFIRFLKHIDAETPSRLELHLIVDNYSTHNHATVKKWLTNHPRFHFHFVPTSSSWLNLIERWFRDLTEKAIRRGVFKSVSELITAIEEYRTMWNENPKPFIWKKSAQLIIEKVAKSNALLNSLH